MGGIKMGMTIRKFSQYTGLPPSTLRFYDRKKLLSPHRLENGYRVYNEDQIERALLIHSLRQADIGIKEIREFLSANKDEKELLVTMWRSGVKAKLRSLEIARKYLGGFDPTEQQIYLNKWEQPLTLIWFKHQVKRVELPFREAMKERQDTLANWGIKPCLGVYVRTVDVKSEYMDGEIGFVVNEADLFDIDYQTENAYIETMEPTLFAILDCLANDPFICFQYIQLVRRYGFETLDNKLEKYEAWDDDVYKLLIPLK